MPPLVEPPPPTRRAANGKVTVGQVRALAARVRAQCGANGGRPVGEPLRRELETLDRTGEFSPAALAAFHDVLARAGVATRHPIGLPTEDQPYWFRCGQPYAGWQSAPELPSSADV